MNTVTLIWSILIGCCGTVGLQHFMIWIRMRKARANLLLAGSAVSIAWLAYIELKMMLAPTIPDYANALWWMHAPAFLIITFTLLFVRAHFQSGKVWLAGAAIGFRFASLIINIFSPVTMNYHEITTLEDVSFFGETIVVAQGIPNPLMVVGHLALLFFAWFVVDAMVEVWRKRESTQKILLISFTALFACSGMFQGMAIYWGWIHMPLTASVFFLGIALTMGFDLSYGVLRSLSLADTLVQNNERMTLITETVDVGLWLMPVNQSSLWVSPKWRDVFGFQEGDEINYEQIFERIHPEDREYVQQQVEQTLGEHTPFALSFRIQVPDQETRWISSRGKIVTRRHQEDQLLGIAVDITQRKKNEIELQSIRDEINHLTRVSALGELSGTIAHELNQPLTAILSNAQSAQRLLKESSPDLKEIEEIFTDIIEDDRRAAQVITRMRDLLQKGQMELKPVDLNETLSEVLALVSSDLLKHDIIRDIQLCPEPLMIRADRIQIQQVFLNLFFNAREAMSETPHPMKKLSVHSRRSPSGIAIIEVRDQGTGLQDWNPEDVFEAFTSTKPDGLGMGLRICKTIIDAHHGSITAKSLRARGTVFSVELPLIQNVQPERTNG